MNSSNWNLNLILFLFLNNIQFNANIRTTLRDRVALYQIEETSQKYKLNCIQLFYNKIYFLLNWLLKK